MRQNRWFFVLLILAAIVAAEAAAAMQPTRLAQSEPAKHRAPGVPMAPKPGGIDRQITERDRAGAAGAPRAPRDQQARSAPEPSRDPPMPRPVPSIIAP